MTKLLHIDASPRLERSKSSSVSNAFINEYTRLNPNIEVDTLNLFTANLPDFDGRVVQVRYDIMHGKEYSNDDYKSWSEIESIINHFKSADLYVFSIPMWNFSIPYRLKHYIDLIIQPGYTFSVDQKGYQGLLEGKKVVCVYSSGGDYSPGSDRLAYDLQKPYIRQFLHFIGISDIKEVVVAPTIAGADNQKRDVFSAAIKNAVELAKEF